MTCKPDYMLQIRAAATKAARFKGLRYAREDRKDRAVRSALIVAALIVVCAWASMFFL